MWIWVLLSNIIIILFLMWLYGKMLCRPYRCVRWICKVRMWWKLRWNYILQSGGGEMECSPLHDTSSSQGGWISPVGTRHFGLQEKGERNWAEVQVKANTITLISHGECCSCMRVTHTHTISHSHSLVLQWLIATPSLAAFLTASIHDLQWIWLHWKMKITGCVYRE